MAINPFLPTAKRIPQFLQWWSSVRQKGMMQYILKNGVVFALLFVGISIAIKAILHSFSLGHSMPDWSVMITSTPITSITALVIGGLLFGWGMWKYNQYIYRTLSARQQQGKVL